MEGKNLQKDTENAVAQQSLCTTAIEPVLQILEATTNEPMRGSY